MRCTRRRDCIQLHMDRYWPGASERGAIDHMDRKSVIGAIIGLAVSPIPLYLAVQSMGAGHGDYRLTFAFFPVLTYVMLAGAHELAIPFALLQYPFYGWYAGRCISKKHFIRLVVMLLSVHVIPMAILLL
jgi:hypothetical protein